MLPSCCCHVAPPNLPFRAVDDAYSTTASANSLINKNIYVLDNDAGNGIALVGAVPLQSTTGSISISNDGQYLQYTAAVGSISGQTISDRFRWELALPEGCTQVSLSSAPTLLCGDASAVQCLLLHCYYQHSDSAVCWRRQLCFAHLQSQQG